MKKTSISLPPVSPCCSGEGLPYAPIDWPIAGDKWSWSVGRRLSNSGFYRDRALNAPRRLQKLTTRKLSFMSESSITRYLQSEFPDADIGAFFASFSWKVPAQTHFWNKVKDSPSRRKVHKMERKAAGKKVHQRKKPQKTYVFRRRTRGSLKQFAQTPARDAEVTIEISSRSDWTGKSKYSTEDSNSTTKFENFEITSPLVIASPAHSSCATSHTLKKSQNEVIPEDFNYSLKILDDILAQPLQEFQSSPPRAELDETMAEARKMLSEILCMDLSALFSSRELISEITSLSSKLQKDSSLGPPQCHMLKLIKEIPMTSEIFEEIKKVKTDAEKFFADLEVKIALATDLRNEYKESKQKAALLQGEIGSSLLAINEIDEQIAILQSQRAEQSSGMEKTKKEMAHLISKQKMVVECLPMIVQEVQLAQSEKSTWEFRKKTAVEREAKILDKFALLKRFPF